MPTERGLAQSMTPRDTVPFEAFQADHPDRDWWVDGGGRCWASDCTQHPKEPTDARA